MKPRTKTSWSDVWIRIDIKGPHECWPWKLAPVTRGYGQFIMGGQRKQAHRAVYELTHGEIPTGLIIDHTCHNRDLSCPGGDVCKHRLCCNPDHLEAVTILENVRRSPRHFANKTHCPRGHAYRGDNIVWLKNGHRWCRTCIRETSKKRS